MQNKSWGSLPQWGKKSPKISKFYPILFSVSFSSQSFSGILVNKHRASEAVVRRKGVLRNFAKFTWKHLCQSSEAFFTKQLRTTASADSYVCRSYREKTCRKAFLPIIFAWGSCFSLQVEVLWKSFIKFWKIFLRAVGTDCLIIFYNYLSQIFLFIH